MGYEDRTAGEMSARPPLRYLEDRVVDARSRIYEITCSLQERNDVLFGQAPSSGEITDKRREPNGILDALDMAVTDLETNITLLHEQVARGANIA